MNLRSEMVAVIIVMLITTGGFLFLMEGPFSGWVLRPKWYSTLMRTLPGAKERVQKIRIAVISALKSNGIVPAHPPRSGFTEFTELMDVLGTPVRIEYRRGSPVASSAGPDKKFYTTDDRVYPY